MSLDGLLLDYGGVLTSNVFESFRSFSLSRGLEPNAVKELFRSEPRARQLVRSLETGALSDDEFNDGFGALLGLEDRGGIVADLFGSTAPDETMLAAVRAARGQGIRTGLISNSMGSGIYDKLPFDELFDGVTISAEVGFHKPQPEIYRLAAERIGVPVEQCVLVDDLRENCAGAEAVGMTAILHRGADKTLPQLQELLAIELVAA